MVQKRVIIPENFGETIKKDALTANKWDVKFDPAQFEATADGLHLKDAVLEPLRDADVVSGKLQGSNLVLTKNDGSKITVALSALVPAAKADQFLKRVTYDNRSKKLKFEVGNDTNADVTNLEVAMSDLLPVITGDGIEGDGTASNPLKIKIKSGQPLKVTADGLEIDKTSDALIELVDGTGAVSLGLIIAK